MDSSEIEEFEFNEPPVPRQRGHHDIRIIGPLLCSIMVLLLVHFTSFWLFLAASHDREPGAEEYRMQLEQSMQTCKAVLKMHWLSGLIYGSWLGLMGVLESFGWIELRSTREDLIAMGAILVAAIGGYLVRIYWDDLF